MTLTHYLKPKRAAAIKEIYRRIVEQGQNHTQIMQELGLPRKTYERYKDLAFRDRTEEYNYLIENNDVSDYVMVLEERINNARNEILDLVRNDKLKPKDRDSRITGVKASVSLAISLLSLKQEIIRCGRPFDAQKPKKIIQQQSLALPNTNMTTEELDDLDDDDLEEEGHGDEHE